MDQDEIVKAVQKLAPTIDQIFIKNLKETSQLDEENWKKIKKKIRLFPSFSLVKLTKTFSDFPKFHKMDSIWIPLENEFSTRLKKMSFDEII